MTNVENDLEYDDRHGKAISNLLDLIEYLSGFKYKERYEYGNYNEVKEKTTKYRSHLAKNLFNFDASLMYKLCSEPEPLLTDFMEQLDDARKQKSKTTTE